MVGDAEQWNDETQLNRVYDALSHPYRRAVVRTLSAMPLTIEDLARQIARDLEFSDENQQRRVEISLHHVHLPKLEDAELIKREDDELSLSPNVTDVMISVPVRSGVFDSGGVDRREAP